MGLGDQSRSLGLGVRGDGRGDGASVNNVELIAELFFGSHLGRSGGKAVGDAAGHLFGVVGQAHGADCIAEIAVGQALRGRSCWARRRDQTG